MLLQPWKYQPELEKVGYLYVSCFCVIFTPAGICCTRCKDETSQKLGVVLESSAGKVLLISVFMAVNRSSGVLVVTGDLNAKGKKHWILLTSISDLIYMQVLLSLVISIFALVSFCLNMLPIAVI